jgi:steroid delta-isomerase-like uncharacterized protein
MSVEQNKALVRRAVDLIWNQGDLSAVTALYSPTYVYHDPANPRVKTVRDFEQLVTSFRRAFPDLQLVIEGQIGEGDFVVSRWGARGTHKGHLLSIAPTDKHVMVTGISIDLLHDRHIVESRVNWDVLGLFQQLGIVPVFGQQGLPLEIGAFNGVTSEMSPR